MQYIEMSIERDNEYMDIQNLKKMAEVDVCSVSKDSLVDIKDVTIDTEKERKERVIDFIHQVKNPYCFLCNGIIVKMSFDQNGETLEEKLSSYFLSV